ncbi:MAG TPA: DUF547 domain-containing protein [Candidatus Polarisedimenticolia bacterium]|nr:DUF547 domain-containing protein [Candidatus Polarisedimenticolia bacterium]
MVGCGAPRASRATGAVGHAVETALASGTGRIDHAAWDRLLAAGTRQGLVDYEFMRAHRADLDSYLEHVATAPLDRLAPGHLEALLINAYNALTVRSILDNPGVTSIKEIAGVWTEKRHRVGGFDLTLDDLEHRILRPYFRDPRIHFAVNCASRSCAPLPSWAYDGARIDAQLEERAKSFLSDPINARVEGDALHLSKYFDWYGSDFVAAGWRGSTRTIALYVARYAPADVAAFIDSRKGAPRLVFEEYDWSLNAAPPSAAPSAPPARLTP